MTAYQLEQSQIQDFLDKHKEADKIPVTEVQGWFKNNRGVPVRTFQWYVQEELIPAPQFEGRNGYYSSGDFVLLADIIRILRHIKGSSSVSRFNVLRNIFRKYRDRSRRVVDLLLNLVDEYPIHSYQQSIDEDIYHSDHDAIWSETLSVMEKGTDLDKLSTLDIVERVIKKA